MKWELRKVYLYVVSLVTLIMSLVGVWNLGNTALEILLPVQERVYCGNMKQAPGTEMSPAETARCEAEQKQQAEREQIYRQRRLIQHGLFLVIVLPAYWYHWRQVRRFEG